MYKLRSTNETDTNIHAKINERNKELKVTKKQRQIKRENVNHRRLRRLHRIHHKNNDHDVDDDADDDDDDSDEDNRI